MKSFPIMDIISNSLKVVVKTFDNIYQAGYMLYFIVALVAFVIFLIFFN